MTSKPGWISRKATHFLHLLLLLLFSLTPTLRAVAQPINELAVTVSTAEEVLLRGRAQMVGTPFWWSGVSLLFQNSDGQTIQSVPVDAQGFFFATIPQGQELLTLLVDSEGKPLSEEGVVDETTRNLGFQPLSEIRLPLWVEDERGHGFVFTTESYPQEEVPPREIFILPWTPPDTPPSRFHSVLMKELRSRACLVIRPHLPPDRRLDEEMEAALATQLVPYLTKKHSIPAERTLLLGDENHAATILPLPARFRDVFGGALVWGGQVPVAPPENYKEVPMAVLGNREDLQDLSEWIARLEAAGCPVLLKSYWSTPSDLDLDTDVHEALDWIVSSKDRSSLPRKIDHRAWLPLHGERHWVRLIQVENPGRMARIGAEWHASDLIEVMADNAAVLRVNLETGFIRFGSSATLVFKDLTLPLNYSRSRKCVEFFRENETWNHRYVDFDDPIPPNLLASIPPPGIAAGLEFPAFAGRVRETLEVDCAWGYKWGSALSPGPLGYRSLFYQVPPVNYHRVEWPASTIQAFQEWRKGQSPPVSLEFSSSHGSRIGEGSGHGGDFQCAVPQSELEAFEEARPEMAIESVALPQTLTELVADQLAREFPVP
jgi:hypothetical protein